MSSAYRRYLEDELQLKYLLSKKVENKNSSLLHSQFLFFWIFVSLLFITALGYMAPRVKSWAANLLMK